jgi:hypothetical protein
MFFKWLDEQILFLLIKIVLLVRGFIIGDLETIDLRPVRFFSRLGV